MRRALLGPAAVLASGLAVLGGACESTQDRSARLEKQAGTLRQERGQRITERSRTVDVGATDVVYDRQFGAAAVVEVTNTSRRTLVGVPIAIDVKDAKGASVFRNDAPGLEPSLTSASVLLPGQKLEWVDDQIQPTGTPRKVDAVVGATHTPAPAGVPKLVVSEPRLIEDPTSGLASTGYVKNLSKVPQRNVLVFGVARRGGKLVAAGRSGIKRINPGRRGRFKIFWIGDPKGATVVLGAPPTNLGTEGPP